MGHQPLLSCACNQVTISPGACTTALLHLTAQGVFWFLASINPGLLGCSGSLRIPTAEPGLKSCLPVLQGSPSSPGPSLPSASQTLTTILARMGELLASFLLVTKLPKTAWSTLPFLAFTRQVRHVQIRIRVLPSCPSTSHH